MMMRGLLALACLIGGLLLGAWSCGAVSPATDIEGWLTHPNITEKRERLRDHRTLGASEYSEVVPGRRKEASSLLKSQEYGYVEVSCAQAMSLTDNFFVEECARPNKQASRILFLVPGVTDLPGGVRVIRSRMVLWVQSEGVGEPEDRVFTPLVVRLEDRPKTVHVLTTRYD